MRDQSQSRLLLTKKWCNKFKINLLFVYLLIPSHPSSFSMSGSKTQAKKCGVLYNECDVHTHRVMFFAVKMIISSQLHLYAGMKIPYEDEDFLLRYSLIFRNDKIC